MTESGNTFESQQEPAGPGAEETNNTATTDATPSPETPASEGHAESEATSADATTPQPIAPHEAAPEADTPQTSEPGTTTPVPAAPDATAPEATASPAEETPTPAAADAASADTGAAPAAEAGGAEGETAEGAEGTSEEGDGAEGGRRGRGRQLPKLPEEEMRQIWSELAAKKNAGEEIEIDVVSTNRGGVVATYRGVEVFIPVSHWSLDRHNTDAISNVHPGDKFNAHVLEITTFDTDARRVTATRRTLLRKDLMASLEVGQRMKGRVASILDFGAFVDLGGVDGLVHASEIGFDRTKKPSELLNKGDEVEVVIREIDREKKRIYLSMKDLLPSPWDGVEDRFPVGSIQQGKVVGIGKNGAFIELEPGLEGFVRVSELSWTKRVNNPKEILRKGMDVEVKVLDASSRKQRLSLSYRQAQPDPWETLAETHAVGTAWEGEVREISNKGVVVSVGDVEGFLPRGRMGREARKLTEMKVGDKLGVNVIEVNPATHSLIFGLPIPEGEGGGGGGDHRPERRGGGGGRGEGRDGDRRGDRRGGDRDRERTGGPVTPVNEMKSADTVTNFTLGDLINDAIKKQLNYKESQKSEPAPQPAAPAAAAAPAPPPAVEPAAAAEPAPAAPAAEAAPSEPAAQEGTPEEAAVSEGNQEKGEEG